MTRPHELQEFYKRYGKPLEVGMVVRVINNPDFLGEYSVLSIRAMNMHSKCDVVISDELNKYYTFSPLDLTTTL